MDKSGYTDMTSIQILVFFALVIIIAVYVTCLLYTSDAADE